MGNLMNNLENSFSATFKKYYKGRKSKISGYKIFKATPLFTIIILKKFKPLLLQKTFRTELLKI